MTYMVSPGVW
jgi:hypothetical protein